MKAFVSARVDEMMGQNTKQYRTAIPESGHIFLASIDIGTSVMTL